MRIIQERRASGKSYNDLLDMLLGTRYEDTNEGMTDQQLLDESLILFLQAMKLQLMHLHGHFIYSVKIQILLKKFGMNIKKLLVTVKLNFLIFQN